MGKAPAYGQVEYWEKRYTEDGKHTSFDWYFKYESVRMSIANFIGEKKDKALVLGCGSSDWGANVAQDGFKYVWCIDFSPSVIRYMKHNNHHIPNLKCTSSVCGYH